METVGILGATARLKENLDEILPQFSKETIRIMMEQTSSQLKRLEPLELIAVFPGFTIETKEALPSCRLLLLPGSETALIGRCNTSCAMSYGISSKDSLTISSLEGNQVSIAVQRELVTITGGSVEQQELILPVRDGKKPLPLLAFVGLLLVLGAPAEQLPFMLEGKF